MDLLESFDVLWTGLLQSESLAPFGRFFEIAFITKGCIMLGGINLELIFAVLTEFYLDVFVALQKK